MKIKTRAIVCLSHFINQKTPLYGGKKNIVLKKIKSIAKGDSCNEMFFSFSSHCGTHLDAPLHFIDKGRSVTDFKSGEWFFNKIGVVKTGKLSPGYIIGSNDLKKISDCELLLIKTDFEKYRRKNIYWSDSPALHSDLASYLKRNCPSLRAVGIDFISISNFKNRDLGREAHQVFLKNNILLIEDMKLSALRGIPDSVIVSSLLVEGAEAGPCTVFGIYN